MIERSDQVQLGPSCERAFWSVSRYTFLKRSAALGEFRPGRRGRLAELEKSTVLLGYV